MWILGILIPPLHTLPPLKSHKNTFNTPPKVNIIRPWKKWCLEDEFPSGALPIFRGQTGKPLLNFRGCTTYRRCQRHDFFQATPSAIPIGTKMVIILAKRADYLWMLSYFWVKDGTNIANSHIYIYIQVVPGRAGGGSFKRKKNYIAKKEFAYRMCARWPTIAMSRFFSEVWTKLLPLHGCHVMRFGVMCLWFDLLSNDVASCQVICGTTPTYYSSTTLYSVLQSTTPVLLCTTKYYSSTTLYYKVLRQYYSVLRQYYSVLQSTTTYYSSTTVLQSTPPVLPSTAKYYASTTLYYKVLLRYYSVLQSTTPVLLCTTKYYSSTTLYYKVLHQ